MEYYNQKESEVLTSLHADSSKGLTQGEVDSRRKEHGLNELIAKKKVSPFVLFINQFRNFIIYILLFAILISVISEEYIDAVVILIILFFNAIIGFVQEYKAEKAIESLKKLAGLKAKVIRGGKHELVDVKNLVPGDILLLEEGNKIPADARILELASFQVSEASLTGESVPVSKQTQPLKGKKVLAERDNMVFSGTAVTRGKCKAVIVSTGMKTEIGKVAHMIDTVEKDLTPLQKKLESLGKVIGSATIAICIIVFLTGVFKEDIVQTLLAGDPVGFIFEAKVWFLTAVALAVAAVPEGLPAIVTIALALGVRRMVKRNALIRKLPSVETLGETTVICSDKTGTLTENEMTVQLAYTNNKMVVLEGEGYDTKHKLKNLGKHDDLLFRIGSLCNDATLHSKGKETKITGDPTEAALLVSAEKAGLSHEDLVKKWKRVDEEPFDSVRKMMSTVNKNPSSKKLMVFTKGAPERLLSKCNRIFIGGKIVKLSAAHKKNIQAKNEELAKKALRVLGFAYKEHKKSEKMETNLIFVGLQGMIDPPHKEVKGAIQKCKDAGIRVIMVTGDQQHTAEGIAKQIGITGESIDGATFAKMGKSTQLKTLQKANVFSRVEPAHKLRIVELLQEQDEVVAMTGDGVNDAPAIKKADLGISMGITGTDVAKEASDMVLQDDNFASIVNAVEEGRGIYQNIKKFVNYLLSCNLGEVFVIFFAIVLGWPLPMTAIMILWLNLVTDGLPALALSVDPNPKDLMKKPPKQKKARIMSNSMIFNIVYVSILITIAVLGLFFWAMGHYQGLEEEQFLHKIQTIAFTAIIVMELVRLQAIRSEYKLGVFSNTWLVLAVLASLALQLLVIYTPLSIFFGTSPLVLLDWALILGATFVVFVLNTAGEALKRQQGWFKEQ